MAVSGDEGRRAPNQCEGLASWQLADEIGDLLLMHAIRVNLQTGK